MTMASWVLVIVAVVSASLFLRQFGNWRFDQPYQWLALTTLYFTVYAIVFELQVPAVLGMILLTAGLLLAVFFRGQKSLALVAINSGLLFLFLTFSSSLGWGA